MIVDNREKAYEYFKAAFIFLLVGPLIYLGSIYSVRENYWARYSAQLTISQATGSLLFHRVYPIFIFTVVFWLLFHNIRKKNTGRKILQRIYVPMHVVFLFILCSFMPMLFPMVNTALVFMVSSSVVAFVYFIVAFVHFSKSLEE